MNTNKIIKEAVVISVAGAVVGAILLAIGVVLKLREVSVIENDRAFIGLSFIPFTIAAVYLGKIFMIKKYPQKMKSAILKETDERLTAMRNEADAVAYKITQAVIGLMYFGYTIMVPQDVFESSGWWLLLAAYFVTFFSKDIVRAVVMRKAMSTEDVEE